MADDLTTPIPSSSVLGTEDDGTSHATEVVHRGKTRIITVNVTTDTAAYANGDVIGGELSFANAVRAQPLSATLVALGLRSKLALTAGIVVFLFDSNPGGTYTDNAAFSMDSGDFAKLIGYVEFFPAHYKTVPGSVNAVTGRVVENRAIHLGSTTLYAVAVAQGAIDFVGTADLDFLLEVKQD